MAGTDAEELERFMRGEVDAQGGRWEDFAAFARDNPDLLDRNTVARWYRPERLASERARRTFLLPEPAP